MTVGDLRRMKRELRDSKRQAGVNASLLVQAKADALKQRGRAERAEAEVQEWKRRFDLLLARTPDASR